eukprot:2704426-Rhodomonas_salina.3
MAPPCPAVHPRMLPPLRVALALERSTAPPGSVAQQAQSAPPMQTETGAAATCARGNAALDVGVRDRDRAARDGESAAGCACRACSEGAVRDRDVRVGDVETSAAAHCSPMGKRDAMDRDGTA